MKKLKHLLKSKTGKILLAVAAIFVIGYAVANVEKNKAIAAIIAKIKADDGWFNEVKAKADAAGRSLESQLRADAIWMLSRMDEYKNAWWNF
jgi:hypothetical protein